MHQQPPILVTGGAGFIGGTFVRRMVARGRRVITLDKLTYAARPDALPPPTDANHCLVVGDIRNRALVSGLLSEHRPSAVVNFAAESHVDRSIDGPADFIQTNILGVFDLLEAVWIHWRALGSAEQDAFRLLQISTDEVFGSLGPQGSFDEHSPYQPNSPYAATKAAADHLVRAYGRTYGLPVLISHCSNNYGPHQHPEKLIPLMINNALRGWSLPVYGDGSQARDWIHVDDHCRALELILEAASPAATYAIGGGSERSNLQVVHEICDLVDQLQPAADGRSARELIEFVADRPGHDQRYAINSAKIARDLGWAAERSFSEGLRATVQWWLAHSPWRSGQPDRLRRGLGRQFPHDDTCRPSKT